MASAKVAAFSVANTPAVAIEAERLAPIALLKTSRMRPATNTDAMMMGWFLISATASSESSTSRHVGRPGASSAFIMPWAKPRKPAERTSTRASGSARAGNQPTPFTAR